MYVMASLSALTFGLLNYGPCTLFDIIMGFPQNDVLIAQDTTN
jgi:hypothetical protein